MPRNYNYIYSLLVEDEDEDDFIGQVAYSLYKRKKISFIEKIKDENGRDPSDEELNEFHKISCDEMMIEAYRSKAGIILEEFISTTLNAQIVEIEEETVRKQSEILETIVSPLRPKSLLNQFSFGVFQGVVATIVFSLLVALIVMVSVTSNIGFWGAMEQFFHLKQIKKESVEGSKKDTISNKTAIPYKDTLVR